MKWLIAIILIQILYFQKDTTISLKNNTNNLVKWNTDFNFTTNGLNQSFLNSFTEGGYITDNVKNKWLDLSVKNNIYFELNNSISYENNAKKIRCRNS